MIEDYHQAVQYLYDNLPMFQRVGAVAYKKDLTNTLALCGALGNPQQKFKSVHVAGTNGKGSTSHMIASVLQEAGYKTGLYTSPHLKSFTERIRIDGQEIGQQFVVDFVNRITPEIDRIKPSFFEITVAMAFDYFAAHHVDVAVIEVGLGGRLDSTNVITPVISVITNIGWDHQDILGHTLPEIAAEKAGIIKPGVPVVISERQPEVEKVFRDKAAQDRAPITFASDLYAVTIIDNDRLQIKRGSQVLFDALDIPLKGFYQQKNIAGVLEAVDVLTKSGFSIPHDDIQRGLGNVIRNTQLKGRWQKLRERPLVICDTGHNVDGLSEVVRQIGSISYHHLYMVLGMVKDKDISPALSLLPKEAQYYFCQAKLPRALDAEALAEKAGAAGLQGTVIRDVNEALRAALAKAGAYDLIFIGGSTFVVAELDEL